MPEEKRKVNLWKKVGNKCLERALELLDEETALDDDKTGAIDKLTGIAISIDILNLRREEQNRYAGAVFRGQALNRKVKGNKI